MAAEPKYEGRVEGTRSHAPSPLAHLRSLEARQRGKAARVESLSFLLLANLGEGGQIYVSFLFAIFTEFSEIGKQIIRQIYVL